MRIVAVAVVCAVALLANAAWCLGGCCPPAKTGGSSHGTVSAPACCGPAAATDACPLSLQSLQRVSSPAVAAAQALPAGSAAPAQSAVFERIDPPARPILLCGSPPPPHRALSTVQAPLLI
jgi:hypothetical protein